MWGWGGDKTETINGFECKVYTASGVEILTKTRVEHLNAEDKQAAQSKYLLLLLFLRFEHLLSNPKPTVLRIVGVRRGRERIKSKGSWSHNNTYKQELLLQNNMKLWIL